MEKPEYEAMYRVEDTHWWFQSRKRFLSILLAPYVAEKTSGKIVDVGAGTGGMIGFLRRYGSVVGIEPNAAGRAFAKKRGYTLKKGTAEQTGLPTKCARAVCFFDVLYHRGINDVRAVQHAYSLLKPGGLLIITDCAMPMLTGPHDRAVQGRERYVLRDLVRKVEREGFTICKATSLFFLLTPVVILKRLGDRLFRHAALSHSDVVPVAPWINALCLLLCRGEAYGLRFFSYPWGSSLCIIAKKPCNT